MTGGPIAVARQGAIVTITLSRPELRNPISDADMIDALIDALLAADRDQSTGAIILTGEGPAFSAGGNLKKMGAPGELGSGAAAEIPAQYRRGIQRIPLAFEQLSLPVIAAVNGPAIGAGCDLACMCDIRIASTEAQFAESFVNFGLVPGDGGAWLLPRIVGYSMAFELSVTGRMIDADEAKSIGLVSRVVAPSLLLATAMELAEQIAAKPRTAVRLTKRLMMAARGMPLAQALELSGTAQALCHGTSDHAEAIAAFKERRPPNFGAPPIPVTL